MSILKNGHSTDYLTKLTDGKIQMGLGIGCDLDKHFVYKPSELTIILGHDNVGKTYWAEWYFLCLAMTHGLQFTLFMDENYAHKVMRDLIQLWTGKNYFELNHKEVRSAEMLIENYFKFVDNQRMYTPTQLTDVWLSTQTDCLLIDPFNGLDTPFVYSENYKVMNELKMINKIEQKSIFINAHPNTESGRSSGFYPKEHIYNGHVAPPQKSNIEGGKPFANKADNFIICHRLTQHPTMKNTTMIGTPKIKDTFTGGSPTIIDEELYFEYNNGKGFLINGIDPMPRKGAKSLDEQKELYHAKLINDTAELHKIHNNLNIKPNENF